MSVTNEVLKRLAEPFHLHDEKRGVSGVGFKIQTLTKSGDAVVAAYIESRDVQNRLDEVVGPANWKVDFTPLGDGNIMCCLSIRVDGEWVGKCDVGGPSDQPDKADQMKAAFSEAMKRAGVQWGISRYLYKLPVLFAPVTEDKKRLRSDPAMPVWALPNGHQQQKSAAPSPAKPQPAPPPEPTTNAVPIVAGAELHCRLRDKDAKLAADGKCKPGELLTRLAQAGAKAGYGDDIARWPADAVPFAAGVVKDFEANAANAEFPFGNNAPAAKPEPQTPERVAAGFAAQMAKCVTVAEIDTLGRAIKVQASFLGEPLVDGLRKVYDATLMRIDPALHAKRKEEAAAAKAANEARAKVAATAKATLGATPVDDADLPYGADD